MSANAALPASGKGDPNGMRIAEITAKRAGEAGFHGSIRYAAVEVLWSARGHGLAGLRGRSGGRADCREICPRLEVRGPVRAVLRRARQGLLQGRRPRRHDRFRPGLGRRHRPRRRRHLSDRLLRHQLAGQVPGPEPGEEGPGRVDDVRQAGLRDREPGQDRHQQAEGPGRQDARRAAAGRRLRAVEGVREGEQHRRRQGEDRSTSASRCASRCSPTARSTPSPASRSRCTTICWPRASSPRTSR